MGKSRDYSYPIQKFGLSSEPDEYSTKARDFVNTGEWIDAMTGPSGSCNDGRIMIGRINSSDPWRARPKALSTDETVRLLDILKSYREEPDKWDGITEITEGAEFVVNSDGAFFRVYNSASQYIKDDELDQIIRKIEFMKCPHCELCVSRIQLLRVYDRRRAQFEAMDRYG